MKHKNGSKIDPDTETTAQGDRRVADGLKDRFKQLIGNFELPKEAVHYFMKQVDETKRASVEIVSREIREYLEKIDLSDEVTRILTRMNLEITTSIRFIDSPQNAGKLRIQISRETTPSTEDVPKNPPTSPSTD